MPQTLLLILVTLCCALSAQAQNAPVVSVTALPGPLHLLQGRGGNVVVMVGRDGILLIDDDYANLAPAYAAALAELVGADALPAYVLNTHWHGDHTGANAYWGERKAVIVAHHNVRQRLSTRQEREAPGRTVEPSPPSALPVVTYAENMALHFNATDIDLQHYPSGHTDGDTVVYFGEHNVVHTGDLFFKDRFPFVDISSGGSVRGYIANVEAVLARTNGNTVIVPGHGSVASREDLQRFHRMLLATSEVVRTGLVAGKTAEAIVADGLGPPWASWGEGFISDIQWVRTLAASP